MASILLTIPRKTLEQLDVLTRLYCKSRLAFLRDFIDQGIAHLAEKYESQNREVQELDRVFQHMNNRASEMEVKRRESSGKWEDSF